MAVIGPMPIKDCKGIRGRLRKLIASRTQVSSTVWAKSYETPIRCPHGRDVRAFLSVIASIRIKRERTEEEKELERKMTAIGITGGFQMDGTRHEEPIPVIDDEKIDELLRFLDLSPTPLCCLIHDAPFTSQQMMKILKFARNFPAGLKALEFAFESFNVSNESKDVMYSVMEKILQSEDHSVEINLLQSTDPERKSDPMTHFHLHFGGKTRENPGIFSQLYQRYQKSLPKYDKLHKDIPKVEPAADNDFTDIVGSSRLSFSCFGKKNVEFPEIMRFLENAKCKTMEFGVQPFGSLTWLLEKYIQNWKNGERSIDFLKFTFNCSSKRSTRTRDHAALQQIAEDKGFKRHRLWQNKFDQEGPLEAYSFRFINGIRKLVFAFTANPKRHCWVYLYTMEENDSSLPYPLGNKW